MVITNNAEVNNIQQQDDCENFSKNVFLKN